MEEKTEEQQYAEELADKILQEGYTYDLTTMLIDAVVDRTDIELGSGSRQHVEEAFDKALYTATKAVFAAVIQGLVKDNGEFAHPAILELSRIKTQLNLKSNCEVEEVLDAIEKLQPVESL